MKPALRALSAILTLFPAMVLHAQIITTIAGTPTITGFSGSGGPATSAKMSETFTVAVDNAGNVYAGDYFNNAIWKINTSGIIRLYAGTGALGGRPQPTGTYVWVIDYEDLLTGKPAQARGTVVLIR